MWIITACYALTALTFVLGKRAVELAHPLFVVGARMTVAGLLLLVWHLARAKQRPQVARADLWRFGRVALFHIYLAFACEFWALGVLPSYQVNLIYSTTPFVAAGLSFWLKNERLSRRKWASLCLGLGGMSPIICAQSADRTSALTARTLTAQAALAISVISSSYAWFDIEILMRRYSILLINAQAMLIGGVGSLLSTWFVAGRAGFCVLQPKELALQIGALIVLSNLLFYNLFGWLLQRYSLTLLTFAGLLSPIFGALYGAILLDEAITWQFGVSLAILAAALALFYSQEATAKT